MRSLASNYGRPVRSHHSISRRIKMCCITFILADLPVSTHIPHQMQSSFMIKRRLDHDAFPELYLTKVLNFYSRLCGVVILSSLYLTWRRVYDNDMISQQFTCNCFVSTMSW